MYRLTGRLEQSQLADLFRGERTEASGPMEQRGQRANESVVLKLFHLKTSDAAYAKVLADIARQLQGVTHGGVARVLDVGMIDGHLAIVRQDTGKYTLGLALQRLNTRGQDAPEMIAQRLTNARDEISHMGEFDYVIINHEFRVAANELQTVVRAERLRTARQLLRHAVLIKRLT